MKIMIFILPSTTLLSLISCTLADAKCTKTLTDADDDGHAEYSCVHATLVDINDIPDEAEWIQFVVSTFSHLPEKAFTRFTLRGLSFYNCEFGHIHPNAFNGLEKLQQLTFYGSNIHVLRGSWFNGMSSLTYLLLDHNDMVYIEPNVFSSIPNLVYLNIEDNNLNCLTRQNIMPLRKLKHVRIGENPWLCTCYMDFLGWMENQQIDYGVRNMTATTTECMVEYNVTEHDDFNIELDAISENSLASMADCISVSLTKNVLCIGNDISVLSQIPENVKSIKFLNSHLLKIPRYAFFRFGNTLRNLDLSNCSISDIHPEAFAGLSKLERLILFNNSISLVRSEWFRGLHTLKHLAMDNNGIEHIQSGVFPLLDKLQTLSLRKNDIGCFPMQGFASMKHLKAMTIANNTWICSCLEDFRKWLHQNKADYSVLPTQCTDNKTHMIGRQYKSGYRNITFQQNFENEERKIVNDNAKILALGGRLQDIELFDGYSMGIASHGNNTAKVTQVEAHHKRNKEVAIHEYYRFRLEERQKLLSYLPMRTKYDGVESTVVPHDPLAYLKNNNHRHWVLQTTRTETAGNSFVEPLMFDTKESYVSVGGTLQNMLLISLDAEEIEFERSVIPRLLNESFKRHDNLRVLKFVNCGLREIEQNAFKGLTKLRELILDDNEMSVVKTSWVEDIPNLERLSLLRNSITRIENGIFQLLPKLDYFGISNNQLNCIGIEGLSHLKSLSSMDVGNNPWSCLCQIKLSQWLIEHKIQHDSDILGRRAEWDCMEEYQGSRITSHKYQKRNSVPDSKFDEITASTQTIKNSEDALRIRETQDTVMQKTVPTPTTSGPEYSEGKCGYYVIEDSGKCGWWCNDGDISVLNQIPSDVKNMYLHGTNIPVIRADTFARFSNLTELSFFESTIREVEPLAFAISDKLEQLQFVDNSIPTIRSSWFHGSVNITRLALIRNSITEIEADVFQYLPNLEQLSIYENNLRCIYTKSLSSLKNLQRVSMQSNPWKWRCREELAQFFEARNISYQDTKSYGGKLVMADLISDDNSE